jgi:hypothetical protein
MSEEYVSSGLYKLALRDPDIDVLSWQSVDGKGYFAADVKIRLPDERRMEPDLILALAAELWVIEVKDLHSQARDDEAKLRAMVELLGSQGVLDQVSLRSGAPVTGKELVLAVAFAADDLAEGLCPGDIVHIDWARDEALATADTLSRLLGALRL